MPHEPRDTRRDILMRPLRRLAVDRANMLRVAQHALDSGGTDRDLRTRAVLPALLAALTHRDGDLELRAARGLVRSCALQHRTTHLGDQLVLGQAGAVF